MNVLAGTVLATLVTIAFAGCVASSEGTEAVAAPSAGPAFDETTGSIAGMVMTDEILPVVGAQVGIASLNVMVLTDETGHFALNFVPPGRHEVSVIALGFQSTGRSVEVTAGLVTEATDFVLVQLPSLGPYYTLQVFDLKVGGELVKVGMECMYGSQYGIYVPPGTPGISNANVKTCQGGNFCLTPGNTCRGPTEVHYGHCGMDDDWTEYGCDFTNEWQTIIGEVQWTPTSAITGRGWSWEILAPNTTRAGATSNPPNPDSGSVDQKDLHDWWKMTSEAPIQTRIDRATALEGSPSGTPGNHPMVEEDLCGGFEEVIRPGGCDWAWRLFPGWCTINGATGQPYGCEKPGPDFVVDADGTPVQVYFTYFIRAEAPPDWSALPDQ